MKRFMVVFISLALILALTAAPALAEAETNEGINVEITDGRDPEDTNGETTYESDFSEEELEKILAQDSPWYFLKRFIEKVRLTFTFNSEKKAEYLAELAEERAKEYEALELKFAEGDISEEELELLEEALEDFLNFIERYLDYIQEDDEEDEDEDEDEDLPNEEDKYLRRIAHLERIAEKAPESAQKGLARAIANAHRQRERMIAKGKLTDPNLIEEIPDLPFRKFKLEVESDENELEVEYKLKGDKLEVKVECEQEDGQTELKGTEALEYLLPILEGLDLNAAMSDEEIISTVLTAFNWDRPYEEIKIEIEFSDGTEIKIESKSEDDEDEKDDEEDETYPEPDLPFAKFELEIEAGSYELEAEFEQKRHELKAKVEIEQEDGKDTELKGTKALEYLVPILEKLNISAAMSDTDIVKAVLAAFDWDESYEKVKIKVEFIDGTKIELEQKGEKPVPITGLPFKTFELEIESDDCELEVEFKQKRDKYEAEVEIERENGRDIELEGKKALEYLVPILEKLNINAAMSKQNIINAVLTAFSWEGPWEELELKIEFTDGTKIKIEID